MPKAQCPQCSTIVTFVAGYDPICPNCGFRGTAPASAPPPPAAPGQWSGFSTPPMEGPGATGNSGQGMAIASLVCGIAGFIVGITAPIAVILGIVALNQKPDSSGRTMAIIGIVLGAIVCIGFLLFFLFITAVISNW